MKKGRKPDGFLALGVIIAIAVIFVIGLAGWYVFHSKNAKTDSASLQQTSTTKPAEQNGTVIATKDGKVVLTLPDSWRVIQDSNNPNDAQTISDNKNTQVCRDGVCGVAGCLDVDDTSSCAYEAEFMPKILAAASSDQAWRLTVEKSQMTLQEATQSLLGDLNAQNTVAKSAEPINGYDAFYVKIKSAGTSVGNYVDIHYFLEKNGYLVHFSNREQFTNDPSGTTDWDNSKYSLDFSRIVKTIKLNV